MKRCIPCLIFFAACADSSEPPTSSEESDASRKATPVTFSFNASAGKLPADTTFAFSDYPLDEDVEAQSPARKAALAAIDAKLSKKLGRAPLLVETARGGFDEIIGLGFWFNARFEKLEAADAQSAFVMTQINRSDDTDTNIVFKLGAKSGLKPKTKYTASVKLLIRTNAPVGCLGVGGSPDAVKYALLFSRAPITRAVDAIMHHRMTNRPVKQLKPGQEPFDAKNLASAAVSLGSIAAPHAQECDDFLSNKFEDVLLQNTVTVTTDAKADLFGLLSSHSGFESLSLWAIKSVEVRLTAK